MRPFSPTPASQAPANGERLGRHYLTGQGLRVRWRDGRVTACDAADVGPEAPWMAPGLLDLQVNGYAGVDFQQDNLTAESLQQAVCALREDGCSRFLLTLITDDWPRLLARLEAISRLRTRSPELQAAIAGWHIEGPFLSSEPGFHGAHDPALMFDPRPEHLQALRAVAGGAPLLLTLAPERPGSPECIARAVELGIRVSLGHTNVSAEGLARALEAGARAFTHLGNGCTAELNRGDNILWRVFDSSIPFVSLIPDGVHVSPALFRSMHRALHGEVFYVTDAMAAAGAPPGRYTLGRSSLEVGPDGVVRKPGSPYLAGSSLRPLQGVWNAARMLRCPWQDAWRRFSEVPARFMGLPSGITVDGPIHLCLLPPSGEGLEVECLAAPPPGPSIS